MSVQTSINKNTGMKKQLSLIQKDILLSGTFCIHYWQIFIITLQKNISGNLFLSLDISDDCVQISELK